MRDCLKRVLMASSVKGGMDIEWFNSDAIQRLGGKVDLAAPRLKAG